MTRRTQFKGNSRSHRRERLKAKALANGVLAREDEPPRVSWRVFYL
ncbi:hypothetical protein ACP80U_24580 [Escherichia coli]|uniref:Antitermination protein N n=1 Tax=Escherichia coli TaxID=562 RepID=A0A376MAX7_ECOLX|nr:hypothetical protein [Escherichia coli]STF94678.1 Antitermination protein N [Escherichia coli]